MLAGYIEAMNTRPSPNISPELFDTLSADDKRILEALTRFMLAEYACRRQRGEGTAIGSMATPYKESKTTR